MEIGEIYHSNNSGDLEILEASLSKKIKCKFLNTGNIYFFDKTCIEKGNVLDSREEERLFKSTIWKQNCGDSLKIIRKTLNKRSGGSYLYECNFVSYPFICYADKYDIKKGLVNNPFYPNIFNFGYIGNGNYNRKKDGILYDKWYRMIDRCYNPNSKTYKYYGEKGVIIDNIWKNFQNYSKWYEENEKWNKKYQLEVDKDVLYNVKHLEKKIYSPETCLLLPFQINNYLSGDCEDSYLDEYIPGFFRIRIQKFDGSVLKFNRLKSKIEAKNKVQEIKYDLWIKYLKNFDLPDEILSILLKYDFSWSWKFI